MGLKVQGDPRRPGEVNLWAPSSDAKEETSPSGSFLTIAASVLGCAAIFLKNKWFGWAALLCCCASFAHSTASEPLGKHTLTSVMFSIFALFQLYTAQLTELRVEK
ncbi:g472 [Coccomyxa viridis]|uniref:G472 protein n=1 Tax=Coccomyxa viridis TaxID=1274662 RepID=A0ABP1FFT1_9CHLO